MDTPTLAELRARLPELTLRDERRLRRRLDELRKRNEPDKRIRLAEDIDRAAATVAARRANVPTITYPANLPVSQKKDEILDAIRDHQVVIVAGETGSGKTTQLPKICLELGRGVRGLIGHTQPRRLAARTVADRIAEELGTALGSGPGRAVGYKVRFTDQAGPDTLVKLMTDGILLAELPSDRGLYQYDTLIIDEAHERSLNVDFILGYVKQLLPRRTDLKVIITSATIDPERFAAHFGGAPIIEVSGRTYPVEVRYRPILPEDDTDQTQAIGVAVEELCAEGPGDVLVFLSGEREIRDTADALGRLHLRNAEILPLYARLSAAEQHRVFQAHTGRRVVLATNVAETSLTVPGIKYVVDPGTARISRYSHRTKVQRLPIEPISQASANQRKGRCGRTSDGICIRLYSEEDFLARPEYTDPEILRTNLASVILQMTAIELGDIAAFPFLDPPDRRNIADGVALLNELGALADGKLTPTGRRLAQLPVDPRLARMILEADRNGCAREVMVIAAALSIQDPRERPVDKQQAADEHHARFRDKESDFLTYLNLWNYLHQQQQDRSSSAFRRMCRTEFLNYLRVREWQDLSSQLRQIARSVGITLNTGPPAEPEYIHQSILAGLLSHIGLRESAKAAPEGIGAGKKAAPEGMGAEKKAAPEGIGAGKSVYVGARGAHFAVFPGSALFSKPPQWIMAAELVETARLWARVVAKIEPDWAEKLAGHLVKRTYSEPHWEKKQGAVMAYEKVTLYGVPLVAARKINYGRVDPALSRELFIRHALVEGDWDTHHAFFAENRELLAEIEELEHRSRRRDILVDDETLFAFYDQRIGSDVVSARHFDTWWKKTRRSQPDLLNFEKSMLVNESAIVVSARDYPDVWPHDGVPLRLTYQFEPGADADGVTVHIPLAVLNRIDGAGFDWQVPGLRQDLVTALLRSLPKSLRRNFVPVPDFAVDAVAHMAPGEGSLLDALERYLRRTTGVVVPRDSWDLPKVPDHLRLTFRVEDADGAVSTGPAVAAPGVSNGPAVLAEGKDLAALQQRLTPKLRETLAEAAAGIERSGIKTWDFGTLPQRVEQSRGGYPVTAYPALVDTGDSVAVRVFDTEAAQRAAHVAGTRRLLLLNLPQAGKFVPGRLSNQAKLALSRGPHRNALDLVDDCAGCAVDGLVARNGGPVWDEASFVRLREAVRGGLVDAVLDVLDAVQRVLGSAYAISQRLSSTGNPALVPAYADIRAQLDRLVYRGFVTDTGAEYLPELPRYLQAIERRLDKLPENPQRDRDRMRQVEQVEAAYREVAADAPADPAVQTELRRIRWMLEELRVNLFAQALGTAYPVSAQRIHRALEGRSPA